MNISLENLKTDERVSLALRGLYEDFGYRKFRMAQLEEYDLYLKNKSFLSSERIITFNDVDGRLMALKPDVTLSIVKNTKATKEHCEKLYYTENVFRFSRQNNAYKEINQMGLEFLGDLDAVQTAEIITLALGSLGAVDGNYVLDISHTGFVQGIFAGLDLSVEARKELLDCLAMKNTHDFKNLAASCGVPAGRTEVLAALMDLSGDAEKVLSAAAAVLEKAAAASEKAASASEKSAKKGGGVGDMPGSDAEAFLGMKAALAGLQEVLPLLELAKKKGKIRVDFSIVNDMDYYSGIIFQGYVSKIPHHILSGGRYDNLLKKFGLELCGMGFAIYLDELAAYYPLKTADADAAVVYGADALPKDIIRAAEKLRAEGKSVWTGRAKPKGLKVKAVYCLKDGELAEVKK